MTPLQDGAALFGRLLLAVIFLVSGFQKLAGFGGTVAFMGQEGLPFPLGAAIIAILVECVGGIGLVIGYRTRLTGTVLAVWCVATAFVAHADFSLSPSAPATGASMRDAARLRRSTIERSASLEERAASRPSSEQGKHRRPNMEEIPTEHSGSVLRSYRE